MRDRQSAPHPLTTGADGTTDRCRLASHLATVLLAAGLAAGTALAFSPGASAADANTLVRICPSPNEGAASGPLTFTGITPNNDPNTLYSGDLVLEYGGDDTQVTATAGVASYPSKTYVVADGTGSISVELFSPTSVVDVFKTVAVAPASCPVVNQPPTASFSLTAVDLTVTLHDSSTDSDGTIKSRSINWGDGTTNAADSHTYASAGKKTVIETVVDNDDAPSAPTSHSITVAAPPPANQPPVAISQSVATDQGIAKAITLGATDPDDDPLTYTIRSNPAHGVLTGTAPNLTYTPSVGFVGSDSFTFTASDDHGNTSSAAAVNVTVDGAKATPSPGAGPSSAPSGPPIIKPTGSSNLANTGSNSLRIAALGLLLLGIGAALTCARRSRV